LLLALTIDVESLNHERLHHRGRAALSEAVTKLYALGWNDEKMGEVGEQRGWDSFGEKIAGKGHCFR